MAALPGASKWYGHYFTPQPVETVPITLHLADTDTKASSASYSLDYARSGDEDECIELVQEAKETGDNVGEGEYSDSSDLHTLLRISEVFAVRQHNTKTWNSIKTKDQIKAAIVIQPSLLARTYDNCLAHIHIFRRKDLRNNNLFYLQLLRQAVSLTRSLNVGYTRCIARVSGGLMDLVKLYRQEGFVVVGSIEDGVKLSGMGSTVDLIMVNNLSCLQRKRRSDKEIAKIVDTAFGNYKEDSTDEGEMLPVPFLPQHYIFTSGFQVIVRVMKECEWSWAYSLWKNAASKGQGYGIDECPSFDIFREFILLDHYCIVFEELTTSRPVAYTIAGDSWYTRNPDTHMGETNLFIEEEFRGRNLGKESTYLELALMKELGYQGSLNDILLSNAKMGHVLRNNNLPPITVGTIPDGTYTAGYGWDDQVLMYGDLRHIPNFSQVAKESLTRFIAPMTCSSKL